MGMGKIVQLDAHIANMIAAGEVVERPMGVVKELVENAIDARSTRITVSCEEGGLKRISVSDNGVGMDHSDALMAFQRHATSKIKVESDLFEIHSLGFRGEAIPSIASVSKFTMITSDGNECTKIYKAYGEMVEDCSYPCNQGTEMIVEGLFYKTPARLKHLKSGAYENSLIQDVMVRFALANPSIAFTYISNGKTAFRSSGNGNLLEVLYQAYGSEVAKHAIALDFHDFDYHVSGYLVKPSITRSTRYFSHVFMNGRMVKTYRLYKAILDGYEDFIVKGRNPICVLNIEVDPQLLDVNVHPSKWEIRISKQNQLEYLLKDNIRDALKKSLLAMDVDVSKARVGLKEEIFSQLALDTDRIERVEPYIAPKVEEPKVVYESMRDNAEVIVNESLIIEEKEIGKTNDSQFPKMKVIGQLHDKFVLCEVEQGLALIDQHAAQERVHYEELLETINTDVVMNDLLVPYTFKVGNDIVQRVDELNGCIEEDIHVRFEPFGVHVLRVSSVPSWMKELNGQQFLEDVLENFKNDQSSSYQKMEKKRIATMACHSSIRFNHALTMDEMQEVVRQLSLCKNPYHCPHGRPTFIILQEHELTKEFLR